MARTLNQILSALPADQRRKVETRTAELALQTVRQLRHKTQKDVADKIGVGQDAVSRMERSGDQMQLSTLRRYVVALGAKLEVLAVLPNKQRVVIYQSSTAQTTVKRVGTSAKRTAVRKRTEITAL